MSLRTALGAVTTGFMLERHSRFQFVDTLSTGGSVLRMHRRYSVALSLVVVALLASLSHLCVLPPETHAATSDTHHHSDNVFHAPSCEAVRSAAASIPRMTPVLVLRAAELSSVADRWPRIAGDRAVVRPSLRLYLQYAALLI